MRIGLLASLWVFCFTQPVCAQFRLQTQVGSELQLDRRFSVSVAERAIWGEGISNGGRYRTMLQLTASPTRYFSYGIGYQLYAEDEGRGRLWRHRIQAEARLRHRIADFRVSYRLRGQSTGADGRRWQVVVRNRVQLDWEIAHDFRVFGSAELFSVADASGLAAMRTEWGASYALDTVELTLGYRYQAPWQASGKPYHMIFAALAHAWDFDL